MPAGSSSSHAALTLLSVLALIWSAYAGGAFLAPLTLALFLVTLMWPIQTALRIWMPKALAVIAALVMLIAVIVLLSSVTLWALRSVWLTIGSDAQRYQSLYMSFVKWLEKNGIFVAGLWAETFNVNWMMRFLQQILARTGQTMSFWAVTIAYVITLLVEVERIDKSIAKYSGPRVTEIIRAGTFEMVRKLRLYMGVRAIVSIATGVTITLIALAVGLPLALEWGVLGFVLNFIPVVGPLIATFVPATFALAHMREPILALLLLGTLTVLQFLGGNYIEPRISGDALRLSPFIILVTIFFWTFIWGIYGTFIGVPIAIAIAAFAKHIPSCKWLLGFMGAEGAPR
jgi:AI-2 transport protein TqsA